MAYGDPKIVVQLRNDEKYGALIETKKDGSEKTYYPKQFATDWTCEKLQVCQSFAYRDKEELGPPKVLTYIAGTARLEFDHNVSIIGEPENSTVTVDLSFRPDDSPELLISNDAGEVEGFRLSRSYGRANMGFNRADWETRTSDCWWLECRLHSSALQHLIDAISNGTLERASLSVRLNNLFTDGAPYIPFIEREHLFLQPNIKDNSIDLPEMAYGWLERLGLHLRSFDVTPPTELGSNYEQEEKKVTVGPELSPAVQASQLMAAHVDALRGTIKWVGGLIAFFLFLLLFK